jgi:two-component system cell cycle sensor histidine kinase/response regulator CckA
MPDTAKILLVDDEPFVRDFLNRTLIDAGYQTISAADGPEAIDAFEHAGPIDLLLADLMMPRMRGDELARRLRSSVPTLRVLYVTGYCDQLFQDRIALAEREAFLDKPFTSGGLLEAVAILLCGSPRRCAVRPE